METAIKACMRELREAWNIKAPKLMINMILQHRENIIKDKYGVEVFMEAEKRLLANNEKRNSGFSSK